MQNLKIRIPGSFLNQGNYLGFRIAKKNYGQKKSSIKIFTPKIPGQKNFSGKKFVKFFQAPCEINPAEKMNRNRNELKN